VWRNRIAAANLAILAGDPALAKSTIAVFMAAAITGSGRFPVRRFWPDGERCPASGSIVFLSAEDNARAILVPRLIAAGADLDRVRFVKNVNTGNFYASGEAEKRLFSLETDLTPLDRKLKEWGDVALVVIDPVSAYLDQIDSHKNAEVRRVLAALQDLAEKHNLAILLITHLIKEAGARALAAISGSGAFGAAARLAHLVVEDPLRQHRDQKFAHVRPVGSPLGSPLTNSAR
jgi:RecA-family ATPase